MLLVILLKDRDLYTFSALQTPVEIQLMALGILASKVPAYIVYEAAPKDPLV